MKRSAGMFALVVVLTGCAQGPGASGDSPPTSHPRLETAVSSPAKTASATESPEHTAAATGSQIQAVAPEPYRTGGYGGELAVAFISPTGNIWCRLGQGEFEALAETGHGADAVGVETGVFQAKCHLRGPGAGADHRFGCLLYTSDAADE